MHLGPVLIPIKGIPELFEANMADSLFLGDMLEHDMSLGMLLPNELLATCKAHEAACTGSGHPN